MRLSVRNAITAIRTIRNESMEKAHMYKKLSQSSLLNQHQAYMCQQNVSRCVGVGRRANRIMIEYVREGRGIP